MLSALDSESSGPGWSGLIVLLSVIAFSGNTLYSPVTPPLTISYWGITLLQNPFPIQGVVEMLLLE